MWKEYSYDQLRGVIKVGDRVRAVEGKDNPCAEINNNKVQRITDLEVAFAINGCGHSYEESSAFLERWEEDEEKDSIEVPRSIEDVREGDVVVDKWDNERMILGVCGQVVLLSSLDEFEKAGIYLHRKEVINDYRLKDQPKTMTKEEAEKELDVIITN